MFTTRYEKIISALELDASPVIFPQDEDRQTLVNKIYLDQRTRISGSKARRFVYTRCAIWLICIAVALAHAMDLFSAIGRYQGLVLGGAAIVGYATLDKAPLLQKMSWAWEKRVPLKLFGAASGLWLLAVVVPPDMRLKLLSVLPWFAVVLFVICGDGIYRALRNLTTFRKGYALDAYLSGKSPQEKADILKTLSMPAVSSAMWQTKGNTQ